MTTRSASIFLASAILLATLASLASAQTQATIGPKGSRHSVFLSKVVDGDTL